MSPRHPSIETIRIAAHPGGPHLSAVDPLMARLIDELETLPWYRDASAFESLATAIVGQQLSTGAANTIQRRVEELIGEWTPQAILGRTHDELRATGLSNSKVRYLFDLSEKVSSGEVDPDAFDDLTDEEVVETVMVVKGIGRWTAEMFLIFWLDRPDVFSMGDVGLRTAIARRWGIERSDDASILALQQVWSPHRSLASRLLWRSLDDPTT